MDHISTFTTQNVDSRPPFEGENRDSRDQEHAQRVPLENYIGLCSPLSPSKKTVSPKKISKFKLQRFAAKNVSHGGLAICMWTVAFGAGTVAVRGQPSKTIEGNYDRIKLGNLAVCGSHICPVCGPRVAQKRRKEVEDAVKWGLSQSLIPIMLTLTTRHTKADRLDSLIGQQRNALRRWKRHRKFSKAKKQIPHIISAFEETVGKNGWHPHIHLLMFVRADSLNKALRLIASLRDAWTLAAKAEGLEVGRSGYKATVSTEGNEAKAASIYMTKAWGKTDDSSLKVVGTKTWGIAEEITLTFAKKAYGKSRTPFKLLIDAYQGDSHALGLWQVWVKAVKGKSVLRFSQGLKGAAGIKKKTNKEVATVEPEEIDFLIALVGADIWEQAKTVGICRDKFIEAAKGGSDSLSRYLSGLGCYLRTVSTRSDRKSRRRVGTVLPQRGKG